MRVTFSILGLLAAFLLGLVFGNRPTGQAMSVDFSNNIYSIEKEGDSFHLLLGDETLMWIGIENGGYTIVNYADRGLVFQARFVSEVGFDITEMIRLVMDGADEVAVLYMPSGEIYRKIPIEELGPDAWQ